MRQEHRASWSKGGEWPAERGPESSEVGQVWGEERIRGHGGLGGRGSGEKEGRERDSDEELKKQKRRRKLDRDENGGGVEYEKFLKGEMKIKL